MLSWMDYSDTKIQLLSDCVLNGPCNLRHISTFRGGVTVSFGDTSAKYASCTFIIQCEACQFKTNRIKLHVSPEQICNILVYTIVCES
jgi:hypothetical protein